MLRILKILGFLSIGMLKGVDIFLSLVFSILSYLNYFMHFFGIKMFILPL